MREEGKEGGKEQEDQQGEGSKVILEFYPCIFDTTQ